MFEKIIVASEIAMGEQDIIKCLKGLKKLGARECLLLGCLPPEEGGVKISSFFSDIIEANLNKQKYALIEQGYSVETRIITGYLKNELNRIATEENQSIIIVAANEQTRLGGIISGCVAYDIINDSIKPVLIVRASKECIGAIEQTGSCDITEHILLSTDFSDNAQMAYEYVKWMVKSGVSQVTLVHVQDKMKIEPYLSERLEEFNDKDTVRLLAMKEELISLGADKVDFKILYGSPYVEILNTIHDLNISLTVMGSQGRGRIKELFLGNVSHNIARHSESSVLLIPLERD